MAQMKSNKKSSKRKDYGLRTEQAVFTKLGNKHHCNESMILATA